MNGTFIASRVNFRDQADKGNIQRTNQGQAGHYFIDILRRLLSRIIPGTNAPDFFRLSAVSRGLKTNAV